MRGKYRSIVFGIGLLVVYAPSAQATHDFLFTPGSHGHSAHWSWVGTTPADPAPTPITYFIHSATHGGAGAGGAPMTAGEILDIGKAAAVWNASGAHLLLSAVGNDAAAVIHVHRRDSITCAGSTSAARLAQRSASPILHPVPNRSTRCRCPACRDRRTGRSVSPHHARRSPA